MNYPSQLAKMLDLRTINKGAPGDTTGTALKRLEEVLEMKPGIVMITLGGNDLRRKIASETAFANLENIVHQLQQQGALVVIGGIDIPFFGKKFTSGYEDLARRTGAVLVENIFEGIWGDPALMSDRIHPNGNGYTIMAEHFRRALEPYL